MDIAVANYEVYILGVSEFNIDRYLAEYSFRINRSQIKETIFNKLMKRMLEREPIFQSQLVCP